MLLLGIGVALAGFLLFGLMSALAKMHYLDNSASVQYTILDRRYRKWVTN